MHDKMIKWMTVVHVLAQSLAQFTVQPESVVQAGGSEAVFECLYPARGALTHNWGLNGVFFTDANFPPDVTRIPPSVDSLTVKLIIPATLQYNGTVVQCNAVVKYSNGSLLGTLSSNATLQIQGPLQPVSNLYFDKDSSTSTTITISWDPPFSLNLTTAEPDIQYCVDVYNVTGGDDCTITAESIMLLSQCLVETTYHFNPQTDPYLQHLFCFVVTARSNVPNATNGSQSGPVSGYIRLKPPTIPSELLSYQTDAGLSFITWMFPSVILSVPPRNPPTGYRVEIMSIDDPKSPLMCSCSARSEVIRDMITLALQWCSTCDIQRHRIYTYTITVVNEVGTSISLPTSLSTHDVQELRIHALNIDQFNTTVIEVTCSFLAGSTPSGIFVIVQSQTSDSDVHYAVGERSGNQTRVIIDGLSGGMYNVVVYDRGEDQLPEEWPAGSQTVYVFNMDAGSPNSMTTSLLPTPEVVFMIEDGRVCIRCILTPPDISACVVIILDKVLGPQLQVYSINRSDTSECFHSKKEEFNIAVFGLLHGSIEQTPAYMNFIIANSNATDNNVTESFPNSSTAVIILAVTGCSLLLFFTLLLCTLILWIWCRDRHSTGIKQAKHTKQARLEKIFRGIETNQNEAYDLPKTLTVNEAYNMVDIDRTISINARPLPTPTPAPVCDVHSTPSPPHIYEDPRLTEPANVEPETISRPSHTLV